tara:strand:- start:91536 stop:92942 length:1407 start_codon:yes stop_codon:yes gene_type:complete
MRLAAKLVLLFVFGLLLIVVLFSYLTVLQDRRLAIAEHERHAADIAAALQPSIRNAVAAKRTAELQQVLTRSTRYVRVRYVQSDDPQARPSVPIEQVFSRSEVTTIRMPDPAGHEMFYTYVPVVDGDDREKTRLEIASAASDAKDRAMQSLLASLAAIAGVACLSGFVIYVGGVRMVARPLNQLTEKMGRVGRGDFSGPIQIRSNDELASLAAAVNEMCERLQKQRDDLESETKHRIDALQQLRHADRLTSVGRMAAGIAHEIGTPLNVVSGRAELILSGRLAECDVQENAETIRRESQRITRIIRELLDFARQGQPKRTEIDLSELVRSTTALMRPLSGKARVQLLQDVPWQPVIASVDAAQIQQVLTNLISNAIHASDEDATVDISLRDTASEATIVVRDHGHGINSDDISHIFEPFFTTKDVGEGTGLGLSISHGIIQEHQGEIQVESDSQMGTRFVVRLPKVAS